jgi:hypothetical protein
MPLRQQQWKSVPLNDSAETIDGPAIRNDNNKLPTCWEIPPLLLDGHIILTLTSIFHSAQTLSNFCVLGTRNCGKSRSNESNWGNDDQIGDLRMTISAITLRPKLTRWFAKYQNNWFTLEKFVFWIQWLMLIHCGEKTPISWTIEHIRLKSDGI